MNDVALAAMQEIGERLRHLELLEFVQPAIGVYITVSVNTTLGAYHYCINVDCTAGNRVITLPLDIAGETFGYDYHIKKIDSTANTLTINGNGVNIDGAATLVIGLQYATYHVKRDAVQWWVL